MIAQTDTTICLVRMLEKYMTMGTVNEQDTGYLFRGITKSKAGEGYGYLAVYCIHGCASLLGTNCSIWDTLQTILEYTAFVLGVQLL